MLQRERWQFAVIRGTGGPCCEWDSHRRRFDLKLRSVFSHAIKKEVCSRWSLNHEPCVTHAEGRSDESVYFQMHEMFKIPPRAQKK